MAAKRSPNAPLLNTSARSPDESVLATAASRPPDPDALRRRTSCSVRRKSWRALVSAASRAANSGPRWLMSGRAEAARTACGTNVGPGMRRFCGRYIERPPVGHDASPKLAPSILSAYLARLGDDIP